MADTLSFPVSGQALTESEACSNRFAFRLWARAHGLAIPPCDGAGRDSALRLVAAFAGRPDIPPRLLAALLLAADLRPDDRLWVDGEAPAWLPQALSLTAGQAETFERASVLVTGTLPQILPPAIRRVILTGDVEGQGSEPPGVTVTRSKDWA